jgi:hypothetical protein
MASRPVPTRPSVNSRYAASPASGRSASAAWRLVAMSTWPARWSVAAAARMMKYITTFEKTMPVTTSRRTSRSS